jgi:hypothetical protein
LSTPITTTRASRLQETKHSKMQKVHNTPRPVERIGCIAVNRISLISAKISKNLNISLLRTVLPHVNFFARRVDSGCCSRMLSPDEVDRIFGSVLPGIRKCEHHWWTIGQESELMRVCVVDLVFEAGLYDNATPAFVYSAGRGGEKVRSKRRRQRKTGEAESAALGFRQWLHHKGLAPRKIHGLCQERALQQANQPKHPRYPQTESPGTLRVRDSNSPESLGIDWCRSSWDEETRASDDFRAAISANPLRSLR